MRRHILTQIIDMFSPDQALYAICSHYSNKAVWLVSAQITDNDVESVVFTNKRVLLHNRFCSWFSSFVHWFGHPLRANGFEQGKKNRQGITCKQDPVGRGSQCKLVLNIIPQSKYGSKSGFCGSPWVRSTSSSYTLTLQSAWTKVDMTENIYLAPSMCLHKLL